MCHVQAETVFSLSFFGCSLCDPSSLTGVSYIGNMESYTLDHQGSLPGQDFLEENHSPAHLLSPLDRMKTRLSNELSEIMDVSHICIVS